MLDLSPGTLRRYERRGVLKGYRLNSRVVRYKLTDIQALLASSPSE